MAWLATAVAREINLVLTYSVRLLAIAIKTPFKLYCIQFISRGKKNPLLGKNLTSQAIDGHKKLETVW